jgi:hypothetical protein
MKLYYIIKLYSDAYYLTKIQLDDCSDYAMTTKSIYYKTIFDLYKNIISTDKFKKIIKRSRK